MNKRGGLNIDSMKEEDREPARKADKQGRGWWRHELEQSIMIICRKMSP